MKFSLNLVRISENSENLNQKVRICREFPNDNSDVIEYAQEMVGTEFFDVTIAITIMKIQFLLSLDK